MMKWILLLALFTNCNKNEPVASVNNTEDTTIHTHLTLDNKVGDIVNHTAFKGFGEIEFQGSHTPPEKALRGKGYFSDNNATMKKASANPITFRRESDPTIIETMRNGSEKEKAAIVQTVSKNW